MFELIDFVVKCGEGKLDAIACKYRQIGFVNIAKNQFKVCKSSLGKKI